MSWLQTPQQPHKPLESETEQGPSPQWVVPGVSNIPKGQTTASEPGAALCVSPPAKGRGCGKEAVPVAVGLGLGMGPGSWDPAR